jgi:2-polyprenyl-3-methyl-5-hydroxy-6-metoxy-1,4-benzoquinol methylase
MRRPWKRPLSVGPEPDVVKYSVAASAVGDDQSFGGVVRHGRGHPSPSADQQSFRADTARSLRLFGAFRREQREPGRYYQVLADDTVNQLQSYTDLRGALIVDVGGGAGYFTEAMKARGAHVLCVDVDAGEMTARNGSPPKNAVLGSATRLPVRDGSVDVCFSSNVLEHVGDPFAMAREMVRVTRPGGTVFLAFTNWLSPWGGHETSPWHYLGGNFAARRYQRHTGRPPKNLFGVSLFRLSIAAVLRWARNHTEAEIVDVRPRYLPSWTRPLVVIPGVREFATWNLLLVLRRR